MPARVPSLAMVSVFPNWIWQGAATGCRSERQKDTTETHIKWRLARSGVPEKPSLLLVGNHLYMVDDQGGLLPAWTRKPEKKFGANGWVESVSSPIVANGRIYAFSEEGKAVYNASPKGFQKLPKTN